MDLKDFNFPEVTTSDLAFPTFSTIQVLLDEAKKRNDDKKLDQAKQKFGELFYQGGSLKLKKDVIAGSWKEKALAYAKCLMGSWAPKHEHKELVCAMIFEECLDLEPSITTKIKSLFS